MIDIGGNEPVIINPSQGSAGYTLDGSVAIRIYNKNGVYFEAIYFKNIEVSFPDMKSQKILLLLLNTILINANCKITWNF